MNFWTFLDRNAGGMGLLLLILMCFMYVECGDGKGCRVRFEPSGAINVTSTPADAGAP